MYLFFNWVKRFVIAIVTILLSIATFNFIVDPYQKYRLTSFYKFEEKKQREILPGLAKYSDYDTIIIGSSMTENFRPEQVDELFGVKTLKLSMAGAYAHELHILLNYVFERKQIKHIFYILDPYSVAGSPYRIHTNHMPLYMYSDSLLANIRYLIDKEATRRAFKSVTKYRGQHNDFQRLWYWADIETFSKEKVLKNLQHKPPYSSFKASEHTAEKLITSFQINIEPLLKEHPDTTFSIIYPPYSALAYANTHENQWLSSVHALKLYVLDTSLSLTNTKIYDFQCLPEIVENLNNYKDFTHYSGQINDYMITSIFKQQHEVTKANIGQCCKTIDGIAQKPEWLKYFKE